MMPKDPKRGPEFLLIGLIAIFGGAGSIVVLFCLYWIFKAIIGFIIYYSKFAW
ncbi:MAG: hypothetical protein NT096_13455 [Proteobacteria bacterium]|nr:hypothetical protein [Pseudomonadota bacterium]